MVRLAVAMVGRTLLRLVVLDPREEGAYFCIRDDAEVPRRPLVHEDGDPRAVSKALELPRYREDIAVPDPTNLYHPHQPEVYLRIYDPARLDPPTPWWAYREDVRCRSAAAANGAVTAFRTAMSGLGLPNDKAKGDLTGKVTKVVADGGPDRGGWFLSRSRPVAWQRRCPPDLFG